MPYLGKPPPLTASVLEDADQDTKIQVEESADEDTIRFDIAGAEVATLTNSNLVLKGTTPTITIGDAGAEDTKIVFDGSSQDYYIGLDQTDSDFKIGLGSAVGTTAHIVIDETGAVTMPLQPCVIAKSDGNKTNVTGNNTIYTATFATEIVDRNSDFDGASTFTAPVTGVYRITTNIYMYNITTSATKINIFISTSNRDYNPLHYWIEGSNTRTQEAGSVSVLADMDASDTAVAKVQINGEGADVVEYASNSTFMVELVA
jgi:hypothetical protein